MNNNYPVKLVRGMRDVLTHEYQMQSYVLETLKKQFSHYAYSMIDVPIIEHTELYLRKSGEDTAARMYDFDFKGRRISLRPEFTASIMRSYVNNLNNYPLPLRLQYSGSVFRYEKPQRNRYRQFTMAGIELIGESDPIADAEVIHLACRGLEELGILDYKLILSNTAILNSFFQQLGIREQLSNFLIRNMENMRKRGVAYVTESLQKLHPNFSLEDINDQYIVADSDAPDANHSRKLLDMLRDMSDDEAQQAVTHFLHSLNIRIETNRDEKEVINRLLSKIREENQIPKLHIALEFMQDLSTLVGDPTEILPKARTILSKYNANLDSIKLLEDVLIALKAYSPVKGVIEIDMGMNRGIHYYSGIVFEAIHVTDGNETQLCGGGRYDDLISALGGNSLPAIGFSYGIERIVSILTNTTDSDFRRLRSGVLIIPVEYADYRYANEIADLLREYDQIVEMGMPSRNLKSSLRYADRLNNQFVIIVGSQECENKTVILRDMYAGEENSVNISELPSIVTRSLKENV